MPTYREDSHLGHKVTLWETDDISDKAITPEKLSDRVVPEVIKPLMDDFQNQIDSLAIHGMAVSKVFGDDDHIGVSQKTLTEAINEIWMQLEDMTGQTLRGIRLVVDPSTIISDTPETVHVTATPIFIGGVFEYIRIYANNALVYENENVDHVEFDIELEETTTFKCVAKIFGIEYKRFVEVEYFSSFWLGAGGSYQQVMVPANLVPTTNGMRGEKNITVGEDQRIYVIVGESLRGRFIRADINGVEIPFTESSVTIEGKNYKVLTSENVYSAGTYNIDING